MAVVTDSLGRTWDSNKHPRDRKGRFIRTFRKVRLFDLGGSKAWGTGTVDSITDEGHINITVGKARTDGSAKAKVGAKVTLPASSLESMNEHGDLAAARANASGPQKAQVPNANVTEGDSGNGERGLAKANSQQKGKKGAGPIAFGLSLGFMPDDTNQAAHVLSGRAQGAENPRGAYLVGLWAHNQRQNGKISDQDFIEILDDLGVDAGVTDESPDGLTGLKDLADKYNAAVPSEWPDVVPEVSRRERQHASGARVGFGAKLIDNDEGKKFVAPEKFILTKNGDTFDKSPFVSDGRTSIFDAALGNKTEAPEEGADVPEADAPEGDASEVDAPEPAQAPEVEPTQAPEVEPTQAPEVEPTKVDEPVNPDFPSPDEIADGLDGRFDDDQRPNRVVANIGGGKKASFEKTDDDDIYDVVVTDDNDEELYSGEHDVSQPTGSLATDLYESATGETYNGPEPVVEQEEDVEIPDAPEEDEIVPDDAPEPEATPEEDPEPEPKKPESKKEPEPEPEPETEPTPEPEPEPEAAPEPVEATPDVEPVEDDFDWDGIKGLPVKPELLREGDHIIYEKRNTKDQFVPARGVIATIEPDEKDGKIWGYRIALEDGESTYVMPNKGVTLKTNDDISDRFVVGTPVDRVIRGPLAERKDALTKLTDDELDDAIEGLKGHPSDPDGVALNQAEDEKKSRAGSPTSDDPEPDEEPDEPKADTEEPDEDTVDYTPKLSELQKAELTDAAESWEDEGNSERLREAARKFRAGDKLSIDDLRVLEDLARSDGDRFDQPENSDEDRQAGKRLKAAAKRFREVIEEHDSAQIPGEPDKTPDEALAEAPEGEPVRSGEGSPTEELPLDDMSLKAVRKRLADAWKSGIAERSPLDMARPNRMADKVTFNDGTVAIVKDSDNDQTRRSKAYEHVIAAFGGKSQVSIQVGDKIVSTFIKGKHLDYGSYDDNQNLTPEERKAKTDANNARIAELLGTYEGRGLAIADFLTNQRDRHGYNWMVDEQGHPVAIDNEDAMFNANGIDYSDFDVDELDLTEADAKGIRNTVESLRGVFDEMDKNYTTDALYWHGQMLARADQLIAKGKENDRNRAQTPAPEPEVVPETSAPDADAPEADQPDPDTVEEAAPATSSFLQPEDFPFERTEPVQLEDESYPPSRQQQDVNDAVAAGHHVGVAAKAGTGKTSTLVGVAKRNKDKKILYLAYNRSVMEEGQKRMPDNVTVLTGHAAAYRWAPQWMKDKSFGKGKYNPDKMFAKPAEQSRHLRVGDIYDAKGKKLHSSRVMKDILKSVKSFTLSGEEQPGPEHLRGSLAHVYGKDRIAALEAVNKAWEDLTSKDGKIRFNGMQDVYRKMWALDEPNFGEQYDMVFLDEAQDTPPVLGNLINSQEIQKVIVGDSDQSIYASFAETEDYLENSNTEFTLPLNKSYRFGPAIADIANRFLQGARSGERVIGGGNPDSRVLADEEEMENPDAILTRTNGGMLGHIIDEFEKGRKVAVPPKTKDDLLKLVDTVGWLRGENSKPWRIHEELEQFSSWDEILMEAEKGDDAKTKMIVRVYGQQPAWQIKKYIEQLVEGEDLLEDVLEPKEVFKDGEFVGLSVNEKVQGNAVFGTFKQKDRFKKQGFKWNKDDKQWTFFSDDPDKARAAWERAVEDIKANTVTGKPDVMISTAHKAKGLEWKRVKIGDDFKQPEIDKKTGELVDLDPEEYRLGYVAVTRAESELDAGSLHWIFDKTDENGGNPDIIKPAPEHDDLHGRVEEIKEKIEDKQHADAERENPEPAAVPDTPEDIDLEVLATEDEENSSSDDEPASTTDIEFEDPDADANPETAVDERPVANPPEIPLPPEAMPEGLGERTPAERVGDLMDKDRFGVIRTTVGDDRLPLDDGYSYSFTPSEDDSTMQTARVYDPAGNVISEHDYFSGNEGVYYEGVADDINDVIEKHKRGDEGPIGVQDPVDMGDGFTYTLWLDPEDEQGTQVTIQKPDGTGAGLVWYEPGPDAPSHETIMEHYRPKVDNILAGRDPDDNGPAPDVDEVEAIDLDAEFQKLSPKAQSNFAEIYARRGEWDGTELFISDDEPEYAHLIDEGILGELTEAGMISWLQDDFDTKGTLRGPGPQPWRRDYFISVTPKGEAIGERLPEPETAPEVVPDEAPEEPEAPTTPDAGPARTKKDIIDGLTPEQFDDYEDLERGEKADYLESINSGDDHDTAIAKANGSYTEPAPELTFDERYPDLTGGEDPETVAAKADELQDLFRNTDPTDPDYGKIAGKTIEYLAESRNKPTQPRTQPEPAPQPQVEAPPAPKTKAQERNEQMGRNLLDFLGGKDVTLSKDEREWLVQLEMTFQSDDGLSADMLIEGENSALTNLLQFMQDDDGKFRWWENGPEARTKMREGDMAYQIVEDSDKARAHKRGEGPPDVRYGRIVDMPTHSQPNITILALDEQGNLIPNPKEKGGWKKHRFHMERVTKFHGFGPDGYPLPGPQGPSGGTAVPDGNPNTPTAPRAPEAPEVPEPAPAPPTPREGPAAPRDIDTTSPNGDTLNVVDLPKGRKSYQLIDDYSNDDDKFTVARKATNNFADLKDNDVVSFGNGREVIYDAGKDQFHLYKDLNYVGSESREDFVANNGVVERIHEMLINKGHRADGSYEFKRLDPQELLRPFDRFGSAAARAAKKVKYAAEYNGHTIISEVELDENRLDDLAASIQTAMRASESGLGDIKVKFFVPENDPQFDGDYGPGHTQAYVMPNGEPIVNISPKFANRSPSMEGVFATQFMPAADQFDDMTYTIMHELGHVRDVLQNHDTLLHIGPNHFMHRPRRLRFWEDNRHLLSYYGNTNSQEGYAEAWAQWILGGPGSSAAADAWAAEFNWPDPSSIGSVVV